METNNNIQQTVAVINYDEFRQDVEETLWCKLKDEAEKLLAKKAYYSMGEVCKIFGRSDKTIERWHKEGILCYSTVMDEGNRMFSVEEVEALKEDLKRKREQRYNGSA